MLHLMLFTNDPDLAGIAAEAGVSRIVIDIERRGKEQRQFGYHLEINEDRISDLKNLASLPIDRVLRINSLNPKTELEIERALDIGVDFFMLPMVKWYDEVREFVDMVAGRAKTIALVETLPGLVNIEDICSIKELDEIYIGLNDLRVEVRWPFGYRYLSDGILDFFISKNSKTMGFGGLTILEHGRPLQTESILKEMARLGAETVIVRRAFKRDVAGKSMKNEVEKIKEYYNLCLLRDPDQAEADKLAVWNEIRSICGTMK